MTPEFALLGTLAAHACFPVLMIWMWPRHRRGMVPVALLVCATIFWLAWFAPGPLIVVSAMAIAAGVVRASDLSRTLPPEFSRSRFTRTFLFLARHPLEPRRPEVALTPAWRVARGVLILAAAGGLEVLGRTTEPWRLCPYLHDLLLAAELGLAFLGWVEVFTPLARKLGLNEFLIFFEGLAAGFAWSRSLRNFWGGNWNRPTSGTLRRGVFDAVGGRRRLVCSILAVFLASGLMHGPQLAFAGGGAQRVAWIWLAVLGTAWFVVHGVACLLEGVINRGRRRRWVGRVFFYVTFLLTIPFYPAPFFIAFGVHGRTVDEATPVILLRWAGLL